MCVFLTEVKEEGEGEKRRVIYWQDVCNKKKFAGKSGRQVREGRS